MDMPKLQKLECLHKAASQIVDLFVIDEHLVNGLIGQVCIIIILDIHEEIIIFMP